MNHHLGILNLKPDTLNVETLVAEANSLGLRIATRRERICDELKGIEAESRVLKGLVGRIVEAAANEDINE